MLCGDKTIWDFRVDFYFSGLYDDYLQAIFEDYIFMDSNFHKIRFVLSDAHFFHSDLEKCNINAIAICTG